MVLLNLHKTNLLSNLKIVFKLTKIQKTKTRSIIKIIKNTILKDSKSKF